MNDGTPAGMTDEELRALDVPMMLRYGLTLGGAHRAALFGDGAVAGALHAEELGVLPRSVHFLGDLVRSAGVRSAADLPEPLPGGAPARLAKEWLSTVAAVTKDGSVDTAEETARWLHAVASVLALRQGTRRPG
ncbi:hypothetical protein [Streptomyces daliensis]|uniref:Uncharacterized protein n=1 Tax=Streptomyces daliensis TaxID=299421 RepID=A0A8T4ITH7_9ACTN|nr:hypothetical protein [Streptomyces daliensis]